uniref:long-chain-fatty-acid--CoA ligase n=1 Tax=Timema monikensis TaxID=170555 RepID=A0A7R9HRF2_9NEOP|nr:unnamed protein product [Timema monikensis]
MNLQNATALAVVSHATQNSCIKEHHPYIYTLSDSQRCSVLGSQPVRPGVDQRVQCPYGTCWDLWRDAVSVFNIERKLYRERTYKVEAMRELAAKPHTVEALSYHVTANSPVGEWAPHADQSVISNGGLSYPVNQIHLSDKDNREQELNLGYLSLRANALHFSAPGPNQVLPADKLHTVLPHGRVKLRTEEEGMAALRPISVPGVLDRTAEQYPEAVALAHKGMGGTWQQITYRGFAAGIYTTNSPEACHYCAENSQANIIVVEDQTQLDKILQIRERLPELKAIIQYRGTPPDTPGIYSWDNVMKMGQEESDEELEQVLKTIAINECCTLVYTSGTVGNPKAVMLSHDNLTWSAHVVGEYLHVVPGSGEKLVSFLPLSHVAAQCVDIHLALFEAATVYFADKDALKGTLVNTLQEVRPTRFLGVPRVWEKIYEKMTRIGSQNGSIKRSIATWAKGHGLQHNLDKMNGIDSNSLGYSMASLLVFNKIKKALGLDRCKTFLNGAAPLSIEIKKYFLSLDILLCGAYGMSETTAGHTVSRDDFFRLTSAGKNLPGTKTKIYNPGQDQQGEVCMWGRHIFMGYLNNELNTSESLDEEGWLHSGDIGQLDEEGFLYITGRIKELLITAGGENIPPVIIEDGIKTELPFLSNVTLIGDQRKFLSVLLTFKTNINMETGEALDEVTSEVKNWLTSLGSKASTVSQILEENSEKAYTEIVLLNLNKVDQFKTLFLNQVMAAIQQGIDRANIKAISNAQKVQKYAILPKDFSIPSGELGPTLKLKRSFIAAKYNDIIETAIFDIQGVRKLIAQTAHIACLNQK